jgi:Tc5 transposase DNA-binding domain/CENP-B N-terminal DNA-binding domain
MSKKYNELSIKEKISLIRESEGGIVQRKLAEKYRISKGQVNNILRRKSEILDYGIRSSNTQRARLKRASKCEDLNKLVYNYFHLARSRGFPISGPLLKEKAFIYAEKLGIQNFKASD